MSLVSGYSNVSVASTATLILSSHPERKGFIIVNAGTSTVYLGMDASVTTTTGLPLLASQSLQSDANDGVWKGAVYGIVASSSVTVNYWEFGT